MTNLKALKNLYAANGGAPADVANMTQNAQVINAIASYTGVADTGVTPAAASKVYWGTRVSNMQSGVDVEDGFITGTLKFIQGGITPTGTLSGDGNFMALKFINEDADRVKVGLVPSSTGMDLQTLDEDMDCVFKITGEVGGVQQVFKVVTTKNGISKTQIFDLSDLDLNTEA